MKHSILIFFSFFLFNLYAQISFTASGVTYSEDFNTLSNSSTAWTDNSTLTGFYRNPTAITLQSTAAARNNAGASYVIYGGTDRAIGGRGSNSLVNIYYGARFKNNTGATIQSLEVQFYGEQWSIAENGTNVNVLQFHYQKGTSVSSLTSGSWTALSALNFTQIYTSSQSSSMGGTACSGTSNQCLSLDGNLPANRVLKYAVFNVAINPGEEIMLRWYETNDAANDHHMYIDDFEVTPWNVPANIVLPITLSDFTATCKGNNVDFAWTTFSERNNDFFTLESSTDGSFYQEVSIIPGAGNSNSPLYYSKEINPSGAHYFRLKQTDTDGKYVYSDAVFVDCSSEISISPNPNKGDFEIRNLKDVSSLILINELGQVIFSSYDNTQEYIQLNSIARGVYFLQSVDKQNQMKVQKVIVD